MTITNYTELQAAIQRFLDNPSLDVTDFISLAEAQFNRTIVSTKMETRSQNTNPGEYVALPVDFLSLRSIHMEGTTDRPLQYITPQEMWSRVRTNAGGVPKFYTIVDGQFRLFPSGPDIVVEIIYTAKIPALSAITTTNWLLTDHPDIYLYGSLLQAEFFLVNDGRLGVVNSKLASAITELKDAATRERHGGGPLIMQTGLRECP